MHAVGGGLPHRVDQPGQHADPGQQHPVAAQPSHALLEQRRRSLGLRPRPAVQEPAELRGDRSLVEHPEPVGVPDLPRVLVGGLRALRVALRTRRIGHAQLLGQVLHHRPRHRQRILQEHAQITHGRGLQHEPEPVVIAAPITYPLLVGVVEQEEPLQVGPRRHAIKAAIGSDLRIRQEIQRHAVRRPPASRTPGPDRPNRCPTCEPDTPRPRSSLPPTAVRILLDPPLGVVTPPVCSGLSKQYRWGVADNVRGTALSREYRLGGQRVAILVQVVDQAVGDAEAPTVDSAGRAVREGRRAATAPRSRPGSGRAGFLAGIRCLASPPGGDAPSDWPAECTTLRRKSYCAWMRRSAISKPESITCCRQDVASPSRGSAWSTTSRNLRTASIAACPPVLTVSSTCSLRPWACPRSSPVPPRVGCRRADGAPTDDRRRAAPLRVKVT